MSEEIRNGNYFCEICFTRALVSLKYTSRLTKIYIRCPVEEKQKTFFPKTMFILRDETIVI